jgi:hypothetical protein
MSPALSDLPVRKVTRALESVGFAYLRTKGSQVPLVQPPHDTGNSNRNALLRGPDGNLVEIVAKVP